MPEDNSRLGNGCCTCRKQRVLQAQAAPGVHLWPADSQQLCRLLHRAGLTMILPYCCCWMSDAVLAPLGSKLLCSSRSVVASISW